MKKENKIKKNIFLYFISISRWKPIIKNSIHAPTGSATNNASDYGLANKHNTRNNNRCNLRIGQRRKGRLRFNHLYSYRGIEVIVFIVFIVFIY